MSTPFPEGGYGERYCPWCMAVLFFAADTDVVEGLAHHAGKHRGNPNRSAVARGAAAMSALDARPDAPNAPRKTGTLAYPGRKPQRRRRT